jgi:hypothetical protein
MKQWNSRMVRQKKFRSEIVELIILVIVIALVRGYG